MTPARPAPPEGRGVKVQIFVGGRLVNPLNSRLHWTGRAEVARLWRQATRASWLIAGRPSLVGFGPCVYTFIARTAKMWDANEGIQAACKPIRDEAVVCVSCTDDSPQWGHEFVYCQEVRPANERGVLITVTPSGRDGQASKG